MPELPEVEVLYRSLKNRVIGHKIISFVQFCKSLRYDLDPNFLKKVTNSYIIKVYRIAKYLIFNLNNNNSVIFHFGITGKLTLMKQNYLFQKHDHIAFYMDNAEILIFNDSRRFGMVDIFSTNNLTSQKYFKNMGVDPLSDQFSGEYLKSRLKNKKIAIKSIIMDNKILLGIGNIYASESLFLSKISPLKLAKDLKKSEILELIKSIRLLLNQAIKEGGTTIKDFVNSYNKPGKFQQKLNVYARKGLDCYFCHTKIIKITQKGRSTYLCTTCQRM